VRARYTTLASVLGLAACARSEIDARLTVAIAAADSQPNPTLDTPIVFAVTVSVPVRDDSVAAARPTNAGSAPIGAWRFERAGERDLLLFAEPTGRGTVLPELAAGALVSRAGRPSDRSTYAGDPVELIGGDCAGDADCGAGLVCTDSRCADVDECAASPCAAEASCTNTAGSFTCGPCAPGYTGDGRTCVDVNECAASPCAAEATCFNTPGSFICGPCARGYTGDGRTCADIDVCAAGLCAPEATCTNTPGSFDCVCGPGYTGDGFTCTPGIVTIAPPRSLAVGDMHSCAIRADGTLWCWGSNRSGELGTGDGLDHAAPAQVGSASDWTWIAAGPTTTCGVRAGELWCWGRGVEGQVGDGAQLDRDTPVRVGLESDWERATVGYTHACGLRAGGVLWCWGQDFYRDLGTGHVDPAPIPIGADRWTSVGAGANFTCGTRSDDTLWCWGLCYVGECGVPSLGEPIPEPQQVGTDADWREVSTDSSDTCAVKRDGTLDCFGATPRLPAERSGWRSVALAALRTCGIRSDDTLWCWGDNTHGALGDGTLVGSYEPVQVGTDTWSIVDLGYEHTCGQRSDGSVACWGAPGRYGALGSGTTALVVDPVRVGTASDWLGVAAGGDHTCALRQPGTLWCWGSDQYGQLGDGGGAAPQQTPMQTGTETDWRVVRTSAWHACGLRGNTLWCWGYGGSGRLGDGTTNSHDSPNQVAGTDWSLLGAGGAFGCGIRLNGTLWCWGLNLNGQLGDNSTTDRFSPVQIGVASDWSEVATGASHTCGRRGGNLWCWGDNSHGDLGDGSNAPSQVPVRVGTANDWTRVASGPSGHSCGLRGAGSLWCWGWNNSGQLGDGTTNDANAPVQVDSANAYIAVATGAFHTCAIRLDGSLWCWGRNVEGQLGNGTLVGSSVPVRAGTAYDWASVSGRVEHTCGLRTDGSLWCWGNNAYGALGDGAAWSATPRDVPGF
jgi:alpha-tubulin suppressor-like RCC1 family protein